MTPLVQYIKDKKASKAKEPTSVKSSKAHGKQESKDAKTEKPEPKKVSVIKKDAATVAEKARRDKATQDAVKAINMSVTAMAGKNAAASDTPPPPRPKRERERGNASAAAKILQRDLGLNPKDRKSSRTNKTSGPASETTKGTTSSSTKVNIPNIATRDKTEHISPNPGQTQNHPPDTVSSVPPTGPRHAKPSAAHPQPTKAVAQASSQRPPKQGPQPSAGATSAFLKHANPSQGVTEPLLQAAFSAFGTLTRCEIDKKKGFGYVDFTESEGLRKAMQASPINVGNGQVVVLENKAKAPTGRAAPAPVPPNNAQNRAQQTLVQPQGSTQSSSANTETTSTTTGGSGQSTLDVSTTQPPPPTAPRGSGMGMRGSRGGNTGPSRGAFGPMSRGNRGGSFRGGRSGFHGNQNRGGGAPGGNAGTNAQESAPPVSSGSEAT